MAASVDLPTRETHPELWAPPPAPGHEPQPPNLRSQIGGAGGGGGGLPLNEAGYYERNGIWWPLQATNPLDPLMGGYGFGDRTDGGQTFHPGADGNARGVCDADLRLPCVAPCDGVVVAVLPWDGRTGGEGNHIWCYLDDARAIAPAWMHWDHLDQIRCTEGMRFKAGQVLGTCGKTGFWLCAHLHLELAKARPGSWWQWPRGWSLSQMEAAYYRPGWWFPASSDKAGAMAGEAPAEEIPVDTTPLERRAMAPYFATYGIAPNMETAIMKRACLAYKRDETTGPCLTDEYPWGDQGYVRQQFTCRTLEWHPQDGLVYYVEQNLEARA